jgi:antitoxin component HigA of HigAB toxin-antitoxin module
MTPQAYILALKQIEKLMESDPDPSSFEGQELLNLVDMIEEYEQRLYPLTRVLPDLLSV